MSVGLSELERELQRDPKSRKFLELSREYQRAGRLQDALASCEAGLKNHPNMPQARVLQAQLLLASGDLKAARGAIERALLVLPDNVAANHLAAEIFWGMGEGERALKHFKIVQLFDPGREGVADRIRALETQFQQPAPPPPVVPQETIEAILGPGTEPPVPARPLYAGEAEEDPQVPLPPVASAAEPDRTTVRSGGEAPIFAEQSPLEEVSFAVSASAEDAQAGGLGEDLLDVGEATVWGRGDEAMTVAAPVPQPDLPSIGVSAPRPAHPIGDGEPTVPAIPATQGDSLSTVTLAQLYEQQGYPEKAVEVYQRLLIRNPDDPDILGRIQALRSQMEQGSVENDLVDQVEIQRAMRQRRIRTLNEWLRRLREERHVS